MKNSEKQKNKTDTVPVRPERNAPLLTPDDEAFLVTAIVSTYDSADYVEYCIRGLERQTVADRMEIIVIDSASPGNEGEIVRSLRKEFDNIRYLRTPQRETVYKAWNRGVRLARGRYLTNANVDDQRRNDHIEKHIEILEHNPDIVLAYANFNVTLEADKPFGEAEIERAVDYPPYQRGDLLQHCYQGPFPVWRKSAHREFGLFNPGFVTAGDREFWGRISQKYDMHLIPEILGDFYKNDDGISYSNRRSGRAKSEGEKIRQRYRNSFDLPWSEFREIRLRVKDNFDEISAIIDELATSGGAFKLHVLLRSCTLEQWAWLVEMKLNGVIYNLIEDQGFSLHLADDEFKEKMAENING